MEVFETVTTRRSIRKFRPDPVPKELLREILKTACWSPSWGNTQAWEIAVVTGDALERLRTANRQKFLDKIVPETDTPIPVVWPDLQKQRYQEIGKKVLTALSIARGDLEGRIRYGGDMASFFGAPCLLLFCVDKSLSREYAMLDIGAILQTVCLLAHARGLGSCILAASIHYPALIREIIPIPETRAIIIGAAIGYPDMEAPVNQFARDRENLDEITTWFQ